MIEGRTVDWRRFAGGPRKLARRFSCQAVARHGRGLFMEFVLMAMMQIRWQRLVDESGRTCDRCGETGKNVGEAFQLLKRSLAPFGIEVELQTIAIDKVTFSENPIESNRIWIGDKSLEHLLGAKVGQSRCCSVCGESECRTVTVDGETHEGITSSLIVRAGLTAAAEMLRGASPACGPSSGDESSSDAANGERQRGCCGPSLPQRPENDAG